MQSALGEALVMRRRTRVRFPPPPPRGSPRKPGFVSPNPVIEEKPRSTPVSPRRARSTDRALRAFGVGRAVAPWATLGRRLHRYLGCVRPGMPVLGHRCRAPYGRGCGGGAAEVPAQTRRLRRRRLPGGAEVPAARVGGAVLVTAPGRLPRGAPRRESPGPRYREGCARLGRELYLLRGRGRAGCGTSSPPCWRTPSVDFSDRVSRSAVLLAASSACVPPASRSIPVADDLALRSVG
jgi:hypothetical protein